MPECNPLRDALEEQKAMRQFMKENPQKDFLQTQINKLKKLRIKDADESFKT